MEKQKRKARSYKIMDKPYSDAMKKASKNKKHLAQLIEQFVLDFKNDKFIFDGNEVSGLIIK